MSGENPGRAGLKQKVVHETGELLAIFLYLALFFEVFAAYRMLLSREFQVGYVSYAAAIISALIMAKVIMLGEYTGLGTRHERKPLIISTLYKAFVFGLLAVAFHVVEEAVKALVHHKRMAEAFDGLRLASGRYELLGHGLVLFCAFIPFFAIREIQRVLGERRLYDLFFRRQSESLR